MASTYSADKKAAGNCGKVVGNDLHEWVVAAEMTTRAVAGAVPAGWYTMKQLAASVFKKSLATAHRRVTPMLAAGRAERRNFRIVIAGRFKVVPHYRLKQKV